MKLILSPKDNINKLELKDVETFCLEGNTLLVVFSDGQTRNYPLMHLWYFELESQALRARNSVEVQEARAAAAQRAFGERPQADKEEA